MGSGWNNYFVYCVFDMEKLNEKQKRFCEEYLVDLNATKAYIRAGYSEKGAAVSACKLLINTNVSEYIRILREKQQESTGVTAQMVIQELIKVGFSNVQDFIGEKNTILDLSKIGRDKAAAIKSVKKIVTEVGEEVVKTTVSYEAYDKIAALEKLGKHLGIFEADNSQKTPSSLIGFYLPQNKRDETPSSDNDLDIPVD